MSGLEWLEPATTTFVVADYMTEWCQREDFRAALPVLLQGEAPGFVATIRRIAEAAVGKVG